ncbi:MAG: helix-turn-helix domain-containing protein [Sphingobacterium paramultivorum]
MTNIAYACGFNSLPNFNKFFKSIKGITPSDYKSKLLSNKD